MDITHTCGHIADADLIDGPAWKAARRSCNDCRVAQARREADLAATLPILTGTDKQIEWARTLRHLYLDGNPTPGLDNRRPIPARAGHYLGEGTPGAAVLAAALNAIGRRQTDAAWWIDHRGLVDGDMVAYAIDNLLTDDERRAIIDAARPDGKPLRVRWIERIGKGVA